MVFDMASSADSDETLYVAVSNQDQNSTDPQYKVYRLPFL